MHFRQGSGGGQFGGQGLRPIARAIRFGPLPLAGFPAFATIRPSTNAIGVAE
jgi:hypothetical protein